MWLPKGMGVSYKTNTESLYGVRCHPGENYSDLYVKVSSLGGTEWHKYLDVSCQWRCVPKGSSSGEQGYGPWSDWYWGRFDTSKITKVARAESDGWVWSAPMSGMNLHHNPQTGESDAAESVLSQLVGENVNFAARKYDAIHIRLHSKFVFQDGMVDEWGNGQTAVAEQEVWISYVPDYSIYGLKYTPRGLQVWYTRPSSWTRPDDRWALNYLRGADGRSLIPYDTPFGQGQEETTYIYGQVDGNGRATIPTDRLLRLPELGEQVTIGMRWNTIYNEIGFNWVTDAARVSVDTTVKVDTPAVTARVSDADLGLVEVTVTDTLDKNAPIERAIVSVEGYQGAVSVQPKVPTELAICPLGVPVRIQAVGVRTVDEVEVSSGPAISGRVTVPAAGSDGRPRALLQDESDPSLGCAIRYNFSSSWSGAREQDVVQLSGRGLPSVAYGTNSDRRIGVKFRIVTAARSGRRAVIQPESEPRSLDRAGVCVLRTMDGQRSFVAVESVDVQGVEGHPDISDVSLTLREVERNGR